MVLLAALVSLGCVLASVRRLLLALEPGGVDAEALLPSLRDADALVRVRSALEASGLRGGAAALLHATGEEDASYRAARIDEELLEVDWTMQRWARVPRVTASIATSGGFLCACVLMIRALSGTEELPLAAALGALGLGLAGASFCAAVHVRMRGLVRVRRTASDRLVERLRALTAP